MNPRQNYAYQRETASLPVVRIDSLDEHYVSPLREFFMTNGCQVFFNTSPTIQVSYQIIVGDWDFVKRITDTVKVNAQKSLILLWETHPDDTVTFVNANRKIALIDLIDLSPELLSSIMKFFFTEQQKLKSFQITEPPKRPHEKLKQISTSPKQREEVQKAIRIQDTNRIARTITSIFSSFDNKKGKSQFKSPITLNKYLLTLCVISLVILLPLSYCIGTYFGSVLYLYKGTLCLRSMKKDCVKAATVTSQVLLSQSRQTFQTITIPIALMKKERSLKPYELYYFLTERLISIEATIAEIGDSANAFALSLFPISSTDSSDAGTVVEAEKMKTKLFALQTDLDLVHIQLMQIKEMRPFPFFFPQTYSILLQGETYLNRLRESMNTVDKLLMLYPYVSGYKEPMNILVLLQNSSELRPTGGFIGSLMNLTITDGKISQTAIVDVYTVDGQLLGHIDPPRPIADLLNQEHWYLRDSNWNPDFRESAKRALWFYEKETGNKPQGVIGITTSMIVKLLELTGPIKLIDFNDQISASNFYAKAIYYTQENFFPGSTQKKDFLGSLFTALTNSVMGKKQLSGIKLFELFQNSLRERNIQLYFLNLEAQQLIDQFTWSGALPTRELCKNIGTISPCLTHYVHINEANVGVNKVNYFIKRQDRRDITIEETGKVTEVVTRTIMNTSSGEPGTGIYKTYIRLFIPKDAHITSFMLDGVPISTKNALAGQQTSLPYGELDTISFPTYTVLAAAIDVPPGKEHTIRATYDRTFFGIQNSNRVTFEAYEQKQSGIDSVPSLLRIRFPSAWKEDETNNTDTISLANNGYLEYNSSLLQDLYIKVFLNK